MVGVDLDRGSLRNLRDPAVQLCADHQVIVFIDAFELLSDDQLLITGMEGHLGLSGEHTSCWYKTQDELKKHEGITELNHQHVFPLHRNQRKAGTDARRKRYDELHMSEAREEWETSTLGLLYMRGSVIYTKNNENHHYKTLVSHNNDE